MKNLYLLLFSAIFIASSSKAQKANEYFFSAKKDVALEDMSGSKLLIGQFKGDTASSPTTFFNFNFAGATYNTFSVSEDGVVVLGNASYVPYPFDNYFTESIGTTPNPNAVYPKILAWSEDLSTSSGGVSYKITGSAPNRKLTIDFKVVCFQDMDDKPFYNKTFQVWLFEGSNKIQTVYGYGLSAWYSYGNIGIAGSSTNFISVNPSNHTSSSSEFFLKHFIDFETGFWPGEGVSYTFSPTEVTDAPPAPTSPITANVSMFPEYVVPGQLKHAIYLGYGQDYVTLKASNVAGGVANTKYSYTWTPSTGLSDSKAASPRATPKQSTTYTVKITDDAGNHIYRSITVYVVNAKVEDKIKLCRSNASIVVSADAVSYQLATGALLGGCNVASSLIAPPPVYSAAPRDRNISLEPTLQSEITIYPNPTSDLLNIRLSEHDKATSIAILNINGSVVAQQTVNAIQTNVQIDLSNKAPGIYLIKISSKDGVKTSKVMVR